MLPRSLTRAGLRRHAAGLPPPIRCRVCAGVVRKPPASWRAEKWTRNPGNARGFAPPLARRSPGGRRYLARGRIQPRGAECRSARHARWPTPGIRRLPRPCQTFPPSKSDSGRRPVLPAAVAGWSPTRTDAAPAPPSPCHRASGQWRWICRCRLGRKQ